MSSEAGRKEFLILGPLEVHSGEQTVRLGAAKQRALLGVLLLHANETVSTSRLVDELWGERPPATAEKLVQGYVHALRKQLGDGVVETQAPGYRLRVDPRALDLLEFERLTEEARVAPTAHSVALRRRALALWRGPPLADVVLEGPERHNLARLGEQRLTTQIERIDAELQLGRHAQLVGELEALVAEHPYQERAAALLMLALYRSGRQAEALEVYRTVRRRLADELGLQPGQELRDLEAAILRQDDTLSVGQTSAPAESPIQATSTTAEAVIPAAIPAALPRRRRRVMGWALALLATAAVVIAALLLRNDAAPIVVPPNSVAAIDPETNRVTTVLQTGIRPGPVAGGAGSVWIASLDDRLLTRVDLATNEVVKNISLPATPNAITFGRGAVWIVSGRLGTLYRLDPELESVSDPIELGQRSIRHTGAGVDVGEGEVWAAFGDATIAQVHPVTLDGGTAPAGPGPSALVVAFGTVWVTTSDATVQQFSPTTWDLGPLNSFTVGRAPSGIAAGADALWVACRDDDFVERIPADLGLVSSKQIPVGDGPTSVAFGAGSVWVTNTAAGTVSRIDPETYEVVETIDVGNAPAGIAVYAGRVWVSVQAP